MAKKPFGYFVGRTDLTPNPEFVRDAKAEKEAASRPYFIKEAADRGMTAEEYIESRGGINDANVYGDSFAVYGASEYLTKAEEDAVIKAALAKGATGGAIGAAINAARAAKRAGGSIDTKTGAYTTPPPGNPNTPPPGNPNTPPPGSSVVVATPKYTGAGIAGNPLTLDGTPYTGEYNGITYVNGISAIEIEKRSNRQSAYDALLAEFNKYGLGSLVSDIKGLIEKDTPPSQFVIELRNTKAYQERFKANTERIKKGLSALDEATYIKNEDAYRGYLRSYGLTQFDNDEYVSRFLANDIRPEEVGERVALAVNKIQMADPAVVNTLRSYYGLGNQDLIAAVLEPKTQLPQIMRRIQAAEIGTAAGRQGFNIGLGTAEQLAAQGVTQARAQEGYAEIAKLLPTAEKLSDIYAGMEEEYRLPEAEQEEFNQLASAQRKRQRLMQREAAAFSGQAGVGRGSLGTATGGQY